MTPLNRARRPGLGSVRVRLMLWNVSVVALALAAMGSLISYSVRGKLIGSVEKVLVDRTNRLAAPHPEDAPDGPPEFGPPDRPPRQDPDGSIPARVPRVFNLDGIGRPPFQNMAPWNTEAFDEASKGRQTSRVITIDGEPVLLLSRPQWRDDRRGGPRRPPEEAPPPVGPEEANGPPPPRDSRPIGVIQAIYPLTDVYRSIDELNQTLLTSIPLALLLAGVGGAWLTNRALRPVRQITRTAASIGAADLSRRLPLTGGDEFAELSGTINAMLERLDDAFGRMEALIEQQRRFTADASHELKTPLTVVKANSSLTLATCPDAAGYHEAMLEIDQAANVMNRLVQDLLLLARADEAQAGQNRERIVVADLLSAVTHGVQRTGCAPIRIDAGPDSLAVLGNRDELARVFTNLVENALRYTPPDGVIKLSARSDATFVNITVSDTGIGIPSEHLPHLCERFYRVDTARARLDGGSGLGLAICKSLVEAHGGRLQITSEVGKGTSVTVSLPSAPCPRPSA